MAAVGTLADSACTPAAAVEAVEAVAAVEAVEAVEAVDSVDTDNSVALYHHQIRVEAYNYMPLSRRCAAVCSMRYALVDRKGGRSKSRINRYSSARANGTSRNAKEWSMRLFLDV